MKEAEARAAEGNAEAQGQYSRAYAPTRRGRHGLHIAHRTDDDGIVTYGLEAVQAAVRLQKSPSAPDTAR